MVPPRRRAGTTIAARAVPSRAHVRQRRGCARGRRNRVRLGSVLNIAAAQGQSRANEHKERVAKHMTQSQVVKAQKLSREYWTRYVIPFQ